MLLAKHDIRDIFIEAGNLPVGEYLYISKIIISGFALYNAPSNVRINALPNESKTYDTALSDARLARIAQALPGFEVAEALARLSNNVGCYRELLVDLCNSLDQALTALKPLILGGGIIENISLLARRLEKGRLDAVDVLRARAKIISPFRRPDLGHICLI